MVSAHPNTLDITRQPPKLGDFFSPYQQQPPPSQQLIASGGSPPGYDIGSIHGYENNHFFASQGSHRPQSVTNLPLRQQNSMLARQSQQQPHRRSPLMNTTNSPQQQFGSPVGSRPQPLMSSNTAIQDQLQQSRQNSQNQQPKNPKLYKTELCRSWMDHGRCNYGERCQYAHGDNEKRPIPRHPKYKTEACSSYHKTGYCPYGPRCHFIHNEEPAVLRQLIAQNATAMATVGPGEAPSPTATPRPRNLNLQQTMSAPPSTVATPMQQNRQFSNVLPIGSRPQGPYYGQKQLGSDGESPIPSSTDSGSESPLGSFSPGLDLDEARLSPKAFHRSISQSAAPQWSNKSYGSGVVASAAVAGHHHQSHGLYSNDPWSTIEASLLPALSNMSFGTDSADHWDAQPSSISTSPSRLPVFERLSNNF